MAEDLQKTVMSFDNIAELFIWGFGGVFGFFLGELTIFSTADVVFWICLGQSGNRRNQYTFGSLYYWIS